MDVPEPGAAYDRAPRVADEMSRSLAFSAAQAARLFRSRRYNQAVTMFTEVLTSCRNLLGPDHHATLTVAGNLGVAMVSARRHRAGIAAIEANLADRSRVWGEEDPATLTALDALATAHRLDGDIAVAVRLAKRVTAQRTRMLGATATDTVTSRMGLICAVTAAGDQAAAVVLLRSAIDEVEQAHGPADARRRALVECGAGNGLIDLSRPDAEWRSSLGLPQTVTKRGTS